MNKFKSHYGCQPPSSETIDTIYRILKQEFEKNAMPIVDLIAVQTHDPFKVLLATILSARTKDTVTAVAAQKLFTQIQTFDDLREIPVDTLQKLIYPVGFYQQKARYLKELPEVILSKFQGKIPDTVEELIQLPGVGRKTANLVVAVAFGKPALCVDTHVHRICNRLGYVKTKTPFETEMALRKKLPVQYWITWNAYLVSFGQHCCRPVNPLCNKCPLLRYCCRVGVKTRYSP